MARLEGAIHLHRFADLASGAVAVAAGFAEYPGDGLLQPDDILAQAEGSLAEAQRVVA